eukprot:6457649-Amphidinium_carterae.2
MEEPTAYRGGSLHSWHPHGRFPRSATGDTPSYAAACHVSNYLIGEAPSDAQVGPSWPLWHCCLFLSKCPAKKGNPPRKTFFSSKGPKSPVYWAPPGRNRT